MNLGIKETIWITKSIKAAGEVATILQANIVPLYLQFTDSR
jgi:hypothetical protein